uniref:Uncharacterized protein n=1 Tax=Ceratitis capitata TaxID=7213 RepID=W8CCB9_CERCA
MDIAASSGCVESSDRLQHRRNASWSPKNRYSATESDVESTVVNTNTDNDIVDLQWLENFNIEDDVDAAQLEYEDELLCTSSMFTSDVLNSFHNDTTINDIALPEVRFNNQSLIENEQLLYEGSKMSNFSANNYYL